MSDITSAREFAKRLITEAAKDEPDLLLIDALSTSAIIRYCRCFTSGIRERLDIERLSSASTADRLIHSRIVQIRNWHIAHPVNQQEVQALYVILDESPQATTGALGFSSQGSAAIPLLPEEAAALIDVCEKWMVFLKEQFTNERDRLMPHALKLTRQELLSLPKGEPRHNDDVGAKRIPRRRDA